MKSTRKVLVGFIAFSLLLGTGVASAQTDSAVDSDNNTGTIQKRVSPYNILPRNVAPFTESDGVTPGVRSDAQKVRVLHEKDQLPSQIKEAGQKEGIDRDRVKENDGRKEDMARDEKKEDRRAEITEKMRSRVEAYFEKMIVRIEAAFDRMARLIERTESRIVKLGEKGLETEEALKYVNEAKRHLEEGRGHLKEAIAIIRGKILDSENPKELLGEIKEQIREAINSLKESREALKNAVRVMKAQVAEDKPDNTSADGTTSDGE